MSAVIYVSGAEKMVTRAYLTKTSLRVRFADEAEGEIPLADIKLDSAPESVSLPTPFAIEVLLENGRLEVIPWDFARHYADPEYEKRSRAVAKNGRETLGRRLQALRQQAGLSQSELASLSGVNRVTIARIEIGERSPRYATLIALARGMKISISKLLVD